MAVKYYDPTSGKWEIFPGTTGADAYAMIVQHGYTGTREEFIESMMNIAQFADKFTSLDENVDNLSTETKLINAKIEDLSDKYDNIAKWAIYD